MPTNSPRAWWLHSVTLVVWALAAASVLFWALKFVPAPQVPSARPLPAAGVAADPAAVARLLGANSDAPVTVSGDSHYALLGVVADSDHQGAALIAVGGKPPKPFLVGAVVSDGLLLQSVAPRRAMLGPSLDAPASVTLNLPAPTESVDTIDTSIPATTAAAAPPPGPAIPPEQFLGSAPAGVSPAIRQRQDAPGTEIRR